MMHMTFYWSKQVTLLIDSWETNSWTMYLLSLLACFLFSAYHQYMETLPLSLKSMPAQPSMHVLLINRLCGLGSGRFGSAVLFGINSALGYLLMLAVMSFNGGVFLAVLFGLSFGYMFFRSG